MMMNAQQQALWTAALRLAAERRWQDLTLAEIAREASMTLAEAAALVTSKADILRLFQRHNDLTFLQSLQGDPLEGTAHDRLFDAMLRRIEILTPHKKALRSIVAKPADDPADWVNLACGLFDTQGWLLNAAGINVTGLRGDVHRLGLAKIFRDVLLLWLEDDDPGISRTMAALDRKLRDGAALAKRLDLPIAVLSGLMRAARAFRHERTRRASASDATAD
jgi:hypothetical protein